jgi:hypothetical protein
MHPKEANKKKTQNHLNRNLRNSSDSQCNGRLRAPSDSLGNETDDEYTDDEDEVFVSKFSDILVHLPLNTKRKSNNVMYRSLNI